MNEMLSGMVVDCLIAISPQKKNTTDDDRRMSMNKFELMEKFRLSRQEWRTQTKTYELKNKHLKGRKWDFGIALRSKSKNKM